MVRTGHCKEDALSKSEFERLVEACDRTLEPRINRFLILGMGRLGLRATEIAHMRESWLNRDQQLIRIPSHEPCDCNYCQACAKQSAENNEIPYKEALEEQWKPKTENSARAIPYIVEERVERTVLGVMEEYGECPVSRWMVNKRIDKLAELSGIGKDSCYPHCLRATAAFQFAYDGMDPWALMATMGWNSVQTAMKYIKASGAMSQKAVREIYG